MWQKTIPKSYFKILIFVKERFLFFSYGCKNVEFFVRKGQLAADY